MSDGDNGTNGNLIQLTAKDFKSDQEVRCARAAATTRSSLPFSRSCRS